MMRWSKLFIYFFILVIFLSEFTVSQINAASSATLDDLLPKIIDVLEKKINDLLPKIDVLEKKINAIADESKETELIKKFKIDLNDNAMINIAMINFIFILILIVFLIVFIYYWVIVPINSVKDSVANIKISSGETFKQSSEYKAPTIAKNMSISDIDFKKIESMINIATSSGLSKKDFILEKNTMLGTIKTTIEEKINNAFEEKINNAFEEKIKHLSLFEFNGKAVTIPKVFNNYLENGVPKINATELMSRQLWQLIMAVGSIYGELYGKAEKMVINEANTAFYNNFKSINIFIRELKLNKNLFENEYSEEAHLIDKILSVIDIQKFVNYDVSQNSMEIFGIILIKCLNKISEIDINESNSLEVIKSQKFKEMCEIDIQKFLSSKLEAYILSKKHELNTYIIEVKDNVMQVVEKIVVKKFRQLDFIKRLNKLDENEAKLFESMKLLYENMVLFIEKYYQKKYFFVPIGINYKDKQYEEYINENFEEASEHEAGVLLKKYDIVDVIYECYHEIDKNKIYKATVKVKLF